jgi:hypothetical protein
MIGELTKSLRPVMNLGLLLVVLPGLGWGMMARPNAGGQQQAETVQPQATEAQKVQPAKPASEPAVNDAPVAPAALPEAPAAKPAPAGNARQVVAPEVESNSQSQRGTAAAEAEKSTGVAASRPAGMAIAPAKQRRRRSFLLKMGALVGAGVAGGTVYALSRSSPGKAPGAR